MVAAEHIGPGDAYQCMGVFDFLLHRSEDDEGGDDGGVREVRIRMTLEPFGKFAVSVFDERDPEHRERRRRHLRERASLEKKRRRWGGRSGGVL